MDPLSLDQLHVFVVVADEGSFSAAARRLNRTQAAVSYAIGNLERLLEVVLFDRNGRRPVLTPAGEAVLAEARTLVAQAERLQATARGLERGVEAEVSAAIDGVFPVDELTSALADFVRSWPAVRLALRTEPMWTVAELVVNGVCQFGICGPLPVWPDGLERRRVRTLSMLPVVAPGHPLAALPGPIGAATLRAHVQLVLTDHSALAQDCDGPGLSGGANWRVADLETKRACLVAGLGWGYMPEHRIADDLRAGRLRTLALREEPSLPTPLYLVARASCPLGPAAKWLAERLAGGSEAPPRARRPPKERGGRR